MTNSKATTIDEYIAEFPENVQKHLQEIRALIKKLVPEAEEAIKYAIPTFVLKGNLVHFGAFKTHIGFYPTPSGMVAFGKELSTYQSGKGSAQFPLDEPMPFKLIEKIVEFRVAEIKSKGKGQIERSETPILIGKAKIRTTT